MIASISVITPSFNQAQYIEATIQSVVTQDYPQLEYLIMDGGSTDGTLDIVRRYHHCLSWSSEPDEGQAQALNKGFRRASGEIIGWLNSDDLYLAGVLFTVADFFNIHPDIDVVYGDYLLVDERGQVLLRKREIPFDGDILLYGLNYISQPATFFRRRIFDRVGYLDEGLHYGLDWEYWLRIAQAGGTFAYIPQYLAAARWHTQAKTLLAPPQMYAEHRAIRERYWNRRRLPAGRWHNLYAACLNKFYRGKRQWLKLALHRTIDFPPGNYVLTRQQKKVA